MIRVLNILDTISSGGVERRRLSMAKLLDKKQFELKIICTYAVGEFPKEFSKYNVEIIELGTFKSIFDIKQHIKVQKIIESFKPHIIHGAVFEGVTLAAINGFIKRVPVIIIEETSDPQNRTWKGNLLMKIFAKLSHKVIGVSPAATDYLLDVLKIKSSKVILINNGVAKPRNVTNDEITNLKSKLQINENQIVIGAMGRLFSDTTKRFSDLIKAFAIVLKNGVNAKLVVVGAGRELDNYIKLSKELEIYEHIHFAGYQNDTALYYKLFDIFSLVSAHESFGLVIAEAMLNELPVVATRVGGIQYIVEDNVTGYLVEKYNVSEISKMLLRLCENKQLRINMGIAGYKRAVNNYSEDRYVKEVQHLYLSLLRIDYE